MQKAQSIKKTRKDYVRSKQFNINKGIQKEGSLRWFERQTGISCYKLKKLQERNVDLSDILNKENN
jgi:hypothetical protein